MGTSPQTPDWMAELLDYRMQAAPIGPRPNPEEQRQLDALFTTSRGVYRQTSFHGIEGVPQSIVESFLLGEASRSPQTQPTPQGRRIAELQQEDPTSWEKRVRVGEKLTTIGMG